MTRRTFDLGANVRRMLEPHVRLGRITVDAIPVEIDPLTLHLGDLLDERPIGGDLRVAGHTSVEPRQTGTRPLFDRRMAVGTDRAVAQVNLMGKRKRLRDLGWPGADELAQRLRERGSRGREHRRRVPARTRHGLVAPRGLPRAAKLASGGEHKDQRRRDDDAQDSYFRPLRLRTKWTRFQVSASETFPFKPFI